MRRLLFFLCLSVWLLPVAGQAIELGGLGGHPAESSTNSDSNRQWFIYTIVPGDTVNDSLSVINNTDQAMTVDLYPADSTPSSDGGFALEQQVEPRNEVGAWITVSQPQIVLPPLSSVDVPFSISIPNDATLATGEHTGGILIQPANQTATVVDGASLTTRIGVRVYVTIPGEITQQLTVNQLSIAALPDNSSVLDVTMSVKNSGTASQAVTLVTDVDMQQPWLRWLGFAQQFPAHQEAQLQVLRNDTLIHHFTIKKPLFGQLVAHGQVGSLVAPPAYYTAFPDWYVIVIGLVVVLGSILVIMRSVHHRHQHES